MTVTEQIAVEFNRRILNKVKELEERAEKLEEINESLVAELQEKELSRLETESNMPQPKIAHWIITPNGFKCSKCLIVHSHTSIFCPSCGAKMVEPAPRKE